MTPALRCACLSPNQRTPNGARNQTGRAPVFPSMASCARLSSDSRKPSVRNANIACEKLWLPISWPSARTARATSGSRTTLAPTWKKVARTPYPRKISRICGVPSLGPSSNVSASARRSRGPRQYEGAKTEDDRPRTAHAINPAAPASAPETGASISFIVGHRPPPI